MEEEITGSMLQRIRQHQWHNIFYMAYIEPITFLLLFANTLSGTVLKNQVIYQACVTVFNYNESECKQLGTKNLSVQGQEIETEVQPYVANLFMLRTVLEGIVPAICGIFIGSWSDHYGRKPLLLISMIGFSCTYIIAAGICELSDYYPVHPWWYILAAVLPSFLGGNCVFMVAAYCFISDITDTETRPYRMTFMETSYFVGLTGGALLSSFIYASTSATATFLISGILLCGTTFFIAMCVPESLNYKPNENVDEVIGSCPEQTRCDEIIVPPFEEKPEVEEATKTAMELKSGNEGNMGTEKENLKEQENENKKEDQEQEHEKEKSQNDANAGTEKKAAGLFSYVHIKDMLSCCFKARSHYDRCIILLVTGTMFLSTFMLDGATTVFFLFVREKFHWTVSDINFFETVSHMVTMFGTIVGFLILRKVFCMSVVMVAILAYFSDFICSLVRGVATEGWHMYLSVALGAFKSVGGPMCRTIVSNIVPATDLGKIFSIKNVLQSIAPLLASPLYTFIYNHSLTTFPGLFYIVGAALHLIVFTFLIVVLRLKYVYREYYAKSLK